MNLTLGTEKKNYMIFSMKKIDRPDVPINIDQKVFRHVAEKIYGCYARLPLTVERTCKLS